MAAAQRFDYHYIHWTGDITAAVYVSHLLMLLTDILVGSMGCCILLSLRTRHHREIQ